MSHQTQMLIASRLRALEAAVDDMDSQLHHLHKCLQFHGLLLEQLQANDPPGRWDKALIALEPDYPTGAWGMSDETARAQVNMTGGIEASRRVVDINLKRLPDGWFHTLDIVAHEIRHHGSEAIRDLAVPVHVLYAIADRESNQGHSLDANGEGDGGNAFGVMQVDGRYHAQRGRPDPYSYEHAVQACEILVKKLDEVIRKHPDWPDKYLLKGAIVAYNSGVGNVQTIERMDIGTTGNDYGADVMARAQYYLEVMQ